MRGGSSMRSHADCLPTLQVIPIILGSALPGLLRPCVSFGLHPAVAEDSISVPVVQQRVGVCEDREDPGGAYARLPRHVPMLICACQEHRMSKMSAGFTDIDAGCRVAA